MRGARSRGLDSPRHDVPRSNRSSAVQARAFGVSAQSLSSRSQPRVRGGCSSGARVWPRYEAIGSRPQGPVPPSPRDLLAIPGRPHRGGLRRRAVLRHWQHVLLLRVTNQARRLAFPSWLNPLRREANDRHDPVSSSSSAPHESPYRTSLSGRETRPPRPPVVRAVTSVEVGRIASALQLL